jgi:hypothetical protein
MTNLQAAVQPCASLDRGRSAQLEGFRRRAVTISRAAPATAPMIPPAQASKRETPLQSGDFPKKANPSPAPSPLVSKDKPMILAISAMTIPVGSGIERVALHYKVSSLTAATPAVKEKVAISFTGVHPLFGGGEIAGRVV